LIIVLYSLDIHVSWPKYVTIIAALASLFLAGYLPKVRGGINLSGYLACLIVYVIVHFLSHLVLTTLAFLSDRKEKKAEIHPMTGINEEY
jgi:hypothetical protein